MQYIIEIDGEISTKYIYNVWSVFEYEDGTVSQDCRLCATDKVEEFTAFLAQLKDNPDGFMKYSSYQLQIAFVFGVFVGVLQSIMVSLIAANWGN